jgi:hypothetical protein
MCPTSSEPYSGGSSYGSGSSSSSYGSGSEDRRSLATTDKMAVEAFTAQGGYEIEKFTYVIVDTSGGECSLRKAHEIIH